MPEDLSLLPDALALKAFVGHAPLASAMFEIILPTTRNPIHLVVGPADERGELRLVRADLEREYRRTTSTGLMDYGSWSGEVFVKVANRATIERARVGYATWGARGDLFPAGYAEDLDRAGRSLSGHDGEDLRAVASSPDVQTRAQTA